MHNAHSLYLEAFAELGAVGGLLVLALVGTAALDGLRRLARRARHPQRERYAAPARRILAFAVAAALDWFWEIAALGAVFFLAARPARRRPLRAARAAAPATRRGQEPRLASPSPAWPSPGSPPSRWSARCWSSTNSTPAERRRRRASFAGAVDHAKRARSIEPFAASPYIQLGLLAGLQGDYAAARRRLTQAIEREDQNWQRYYLRSRVEREAGDPAAASADLERARRLNPAPVPPRPDCG